MDMQRAVTRGALMRLLKEIAHATRVAIDARYIALEARVKALEERPSLKYVGTWQPGTSYPDQAAVSFQGSIWVAHVANTSVRPGDGMVWQSACKRGADGKDLR
jgi:hypothetical protein